MLTVVLILVGVALLAALLGFGGIAVGIAKIAKTIFFIFLALVLISFVIGLFVGF